MTEDGLAANIVMGASGPIDLLAKVVTVEPGESFGEVLKSSDELLLPELSSMVLALVNLLLQTG